MNCNLCPRNCNIDRTSSPGFCSSPASLRLARASLHMWEEPCISGENGSGTVFFCGCNLKCVYCQNREISSGRKGKEISLTRLTEIFLELQQKGAHNINLVTPTHYAPEITDAVRMAREKGLNIPIVYNCGGYENLSQIKALEKTVDIYMPDFKYIHGDLAEKYSFAKDYPVVIKRVLDEMVKQKELVFDDNGMMKQGVLVRHLILPGYIENSKEILKYLNENFGDRIIISIMNQFTPFGLEKYPEINRCVTKEEYDEVVSYAISLGIDNAYIQEGETASESFIPEFNNSGL